MANQSFPLLLSPPGNTEDRQHVLSLVIQLFFRINQKLRGFSGLSVSPGLVVPGGMMPSCRVCWQQELHSGHMLGVGSCATTELPRFPLLLMCQGTGQTALGGETWRVCFGAGAGPKGQWDWRQFHSSFILREQSEVVGGGEHSPRLKSQRGRALGQRARAPAAKEGARSRV